MATSSTPPALQKKRARQIVDGPISRFILVVIMGCFVAGANHIAFTDVVSIKDDLWLNSHGTLAKNPSLDVIQHHHPPPELCAYYFTQQDKHYSKCIFLWLPLVLIDEKSPQIIHYDPASPEHISTSWGRQILFSRICSCLVILLFTVCADLGILFYVFIYIIQKLPSKKPPDAPPGAATVTPSPPIPKA